MRRTPLVIAIVAGSTALAESNVSESAKHSWGENIGWMNWRDAEGGVSGVALSEDRDFLSGYIWGENVGWISVGDGIGPYANDDGTRHGVNIEPDGTLSGYAWGENVGWIDFGTADAMVSDPARYDAESKRLRGFAWGENIGWINLDDAPALVAFEFPCPGDITGNGEVNAADLAEILAGWDQPGPSDLNGDGITDSSDLAIVLAGWGDCE